jgi:NitT/TauT family transport system permease protein
MSGAGWVRRIAPPLVPAVVGVVLLESLVRAGALPAYLVPAPSSVARAMAVHAGPLLSATTQTAAGAAGGFALAAVLGVALAVLLSASRWVERSLYPYAVFFQTVPVVAIAPMLVIWTGNGPRAVIAAATIVAIFPVIAATLGGLRSTDPALRDLFRLYRAGPVATLLRLRLPYATPSIVTGLRIGAGLAVVGAIVGEFVTTGSGLGGYMTISKTQQAVDRVFAALILSALLGVALFGLVNLLGHVLLRRWHASEQ